MKKGKSFLLLLLAVCLGGCTTFNEATTHYNADPTLSLVASTNNEALYYYPSTIKLISPNFFQVWTISLDNNSKMQKSLWFINCSDGTYSVKERGIFNNYGNGALIFSEVNPSLYSYSYGFQDDYPTFVNPPPDSFESKLISEICNN